MVQTFKESKDELGWRDFSILAVNVLFLASLTGLVAITLLLLLATFFTSLHVISLRSIWS
jgi:hypothetical protein